METLKLYTFFMDFRGGTYISQVKAQNQNDAIEHWANQLQIDEIQFLNIKSKQQLINNLPELIENAMITPIENLNNVWCFNYQFKTGYALIHFVLTQS